MKIFFRVLFLAFLACSCSNKIDGNWQQHVSYTMVIDVDAEDRSYSGTQKLIYTNNSPDTISRVFYHLYFNAFKPGSEMQLRASELNDDNRKISKKILSLEKKDFFLNYAVENNVFLFLEHDSVIEVVSLKKTDKGVRINEIFKYEDVF